MQAPKHVEVPIWFFIGCLLTVYGLLIAGADIASRFSAPAQTVVLAELHAGLWWGIFLLALGLFYCFHFHPFRR